MTTQTRTTLTLRLFVAAELRDGVTDHRREAERITRLINEEDRDEYLTQAVMTVIASLNVRRRNDAADQTPILHEQPEPGHTPTETHVPHAGSDSVTPTVKHRDKWVGLRELMGKTTQGADGTMKLIRDMDRADLRHAISVRERLGNSMLARAEEFRRLLNEVERQRVATVGDLHLSDGDQ